MKSPYTEDCTADFIYARMHGQETKFKKGYPPAALKWLADRVQCWSAGKQPADAQLVSSSKAKSVKRDCYVYFDTEAKDYAPNDALNLLKLIK